MKKMRVIIAEDEKYMRERLVNLINSQTDMEVVCSVSSGKELVDAVDSYRVDIILSDVEMDSKTDGIVSANQILMFYPNVHIIFLSVHDDDDTIFSAFEVNAVNYLLKSASTEEILSSIRKAYDNHSPISPYVADKLRGEFNRLKKNEQSLLFFLNIVCMLTVSERQIIKLLLTGKKIREISEIRNVELSTIKTQITHLLKKFNVKRTKDIISMINQLNIKQLFLMIPN